jgi:Fur family transcriptional regulator, stress-responsive regulator
MDDAPIPDRLRAAGLRVTGPRVAVYGVLDEARTAGGHLTAAEVAEGARSRAPGVSTQAVYDCLDALTRTGLVRRIEPAGRPALFEARVGDNHHHLVCRGCGTAVDVDCTHGAAPCLAPDDAHGFVVDEAEVVFWGLCPGCAAAPAEPGAALRATVGPVGATRAPRPSRSPRPGSVSTALLSPPVPPAPSTSPPTGSFPAGARRPTPV